MGEARAKNSAEKTTAANSPPQKASADHLPRPLFVLRSQSVRHHAGPAYGEEIRDRREHHKDRAHHRHRARLPGLVEQPTK